MPYLPLAVRTAVIAAVAIIGSATVASAQSAKPVPKHAPVCAKGVKVYTERSQIPVPFDTLAIPPADGPIRVTNEQEAEAAELALRGRAGSIGANAVLITDETKEDADGGRRLTRSVKGLFVPADSARAQQACK